MAPGNDVVCSRSLTDVTTATSKRQRLTTSTGTLASPSSLHAPLPTLPFDLLSEILCRLPVKLLLQLKCVCKSWKYLISDPKFAKKHLRVSNTYHHHHHVIVKGSDRLLWDSTISSIFSDASTTSAVPQLELIRPKAVNNKYNRYRSTASSCDGILLFTINKHSALLWNPSIRKFKILPPLDFASSVEYTFGYDHFIDNYKVFAVTYGTCNIEVSVYTLGADSWRSIDDFPNRGPILGPGMFVSGSVNWLVVVHDAQLSHPRQSRVVVSLDLEKESYRRLLIPDMKNDNPTLGVLRDCLCIFARNGEFFDVWVMKEYGIEESWTKLFNVPYMGGRRSFYTEVVYVYEDDQVLLDFKDHKELPMGDLKFVIYNSRNGTFKVPKIQNMNDWMAPVVYVESLISPCS